MKTLYLTLLAAILPVSLSSTLNSSQNTPSATSTATIEDYLSTDEEIADYYSALNDYDLENLKGDEFLSVLQTILKDGQVLMSYDGKVSGKSGTKIWDSYLLLDRNWDLSPLTTDEINALDSVEAYWWETDDIWINALYEEDPILFDRSVVNQSGSSYTIDREHVFPKSYGFNGIDGDSSSYQDIYAGVDTHNLHASEGDANSYHSNYPYGEVSDDDKKAVTSSWTGEENGWRGTAEADTYDGIVFEPLEKDKGDIARSIFYMAARYHDYEDESNGDGYPNPALRLSDTPDEPSGTREPSETAETPAVYGILSDLMDWNELDEVSEAEKIRNDLNYQFLQKNRNPFIDYPLWADIAFNPDTTYVVDLTKPSGVSDNSFLLENEDEFDTQYDVGDSIDLTGLSFVDTGEVITDLSLISLDVTNLFTEEVVQSYESLAEVTSITIGNEGYYELLFTYNEKTVSIDITIGNPTFEYSVDFSSLAEEYTTFNKVDFSAITATVTLGSDTKTLDATDLTITLVKGSSTEIVDTSETYTVYFGSFEVNASYDALDGETYTETFSFSVSVPTYLIYVVIALVVVILLIIIIAACVSKSKKKKSSKSKSSKKKKSSKK